MVRELVEAGLDELLHCGSLVDDTLHDVVDRLYFNGGPALPHLFLKQWICRPTNNFSLESRNAFKSLCALLLHDTWTMYF